MSESASLDFEAWKVIGEAKPLFVGDVLRLSDTGELETFEGPLSVVGFQLGSLPRRASYNKVDTR